MTRQILSGKPPAHLSKPTTDKPAKPRKSPSSTPKPKETSETTSFEKSPNSTQVIYPGAVRKHPLAKCEECPLYETGTFVPSSIPTGPTNGLAFIGESPGTQEKKKGKVFIGPSGQLLDKVLEAHGISREESLLTNGALCNYRDEDKKSLPGAIAACRPRLESELQDAGVRTAITLGNAAVSSVLDTKTGITKLRGGEAKDSNLIEGLKVVPTFHPAFCLRDQGKFPLMLSDIGKIKSRPSTWIEPTIHVITDRDQALRVLRGANTQYPFVLDVETGKEKEQQYSRTTNLLCVGLGSTNPNHANRVVVIGRPAIHNAEVEDALIHLISKSNVICQNGKFDCYILHTINHVGLPVYLQADTMLMSYSLNENPGTHGLKYMGVEYLGAPSWEDEIKPYLHKYQDPPEIRWQALAHIRDALSQGPELRSRILKNGPLDVIEAAIKRASQELHVVEFKEGSRIYWQLPSSLPLVAPREADGSYASIPPPILHKYNAYDVQVTRQLYDYFREQQEAEDLVEFNKHLMVMSNALMRVERNGLYLDYKFNSTLHKQFTEYIDSLAGIFPEGLNPNSWQQLLRFIEDNYGYNLDSTSEETLTAYVHDAKTAEPFRQFCEKILEYRRWNKLRSTYVTSIKKLALENGGRVLPTFKIDQATTGRLASKNPNVQNMPRQFDIKRQFIPSSRGRVFVHADYSQLELRVITWLAQDESMRALFNDPERDVFDELALYVYGYTKEAWLELKRTNPKQAKEMRVVVKSFAYGIAYGRTPQGIAQDPDLDITVDEAVARYKIFSEQIPTILAFQKQVIRRIHRGEDLVNVFGRRRRFHLITNQNKHDLEKQAMAYLPQSTASDICVTALSRLPGYFDPRNIIHDAILIEAPRDEAKEQGKLLVKTMIETAEEITGGYVKFDVDYEIGENWQDLLKPQKWIESQSA